MAGAVTDIFTNMAAAFTPFYDSFKQRFMPHATSDLKASEKRAKEAAFRVNHEEPLDEKKLFRRRCQIRDKCLGHPKIAEQLAGLLAKVIQRNAYSDEALLGEIIAMYAEFILSPAVQLFDLQIKKAHMAQYEKVEKLSIIYRRDEDGKFPTIYELDENGELDRTRPVETITYQLDKNGELDLTKPVEISPPELLIWKNGYFPDPEISDPRTFIRMLSMCLAEFTGKVLGTQTLDELNRARLGIQDSHSSGNKLPAPNVINQPSNTPKPNL